MLLTASGMKLDGGGDLTMAVFCGYGVGFSTRGVCAFVPQKYLLYLKCEETTPLNRCSGDDSSSW